MKRIYLIGIIKNSRNMGFLLVDIMNSLCFVIITISEYYFITI